MTHPADRLRTYINDAAITTSELAAFIGYGRTSTSQILNRRRIPSLVAAAKIEALTRAWSRGPILASEWARHAPEREEREAA